MHDISTATYLPSLTGLRFYAALLVVLYHLNSHAGRIPLVSELTRFGRTGVTFFFVLSGFVLMWSYWGKDAKESNIPVGVKTERVEEKIPAAAWQHEGKVEVVVQPASPITSSPARAQSGRKWARKVD